LPLQALFHRAGEESLPSFPRLAATLHCARGARAAAVSQTAPAHTVDRFDTIKLPCFPAVPGRALEIRLHQDRRVFFSALPALWRTIRRSWGHAAKIFGKMEIHETIFIPELKA